MNKFLRLGRDRQQQQQNKQTIKFVGNFYGISHSDFLEGRFFS